MLLRNLDNVKNLFTSFSGTFIGVGMTAFSRVAPAYFLKPYPVIALRKTRDLPLLRKKREIFCLEEELGSFVTEPGFNSARLLAHPLVKNYLAEKEDPKYLFLYQSYRELEKMAGDQGWSLLANSAALRLRVGERSFFQEMIGRLNLNRIPGGLYPVEQLYERDYDKWAERLGPRLVIRLADIRQGGGRGTFFIDSLQSYRHLQYLLKKEGVWWGTKIKHLSIHKFVEGQPISLTLCLTRQGILFSDVQRQLIDLPYCREILEKGVFCGHSWEKDFWDSTVRNETLRQAGSIGEYLSKLGYKGILGVDFILSEDGETLYPLECNPRLTGAFPMLSMLHLERGIIPMEVFHMLEFMGVPYDIDVESLNSQYREGVRGSHLILFRLHHDFRAGCRPTEAGLYEFDQEKKEASFLGGETDYSAMHNERQFILIDGPPDTGGKPMKIEDPLYRLCHILFPHPIMNDQQKISSHAIAVVDWAYQQMFPGNKDDIEP
ncbi:ATP-grasp domain-containing protein [Thermodesulfobacteriota bacterium]